MHTEQTILNQIANTISINSHKFGWATTDEDNQKFEIWLQIEIFHGFMTSNDRSSRRNGEYHPTNNNLAREVNLTSFYPGAQRRSIDFAISETPYSTFESTNRIFGIELKQGFPSANDAAMKDIYHALAPAIIDCPQRVKSSINRGMAVFILLKPHAQRDVKKIINLIERFNQFNQFNHPGFNHWSIICDETNDPNFVVVAVIEGYSGQNKTIYYPASNWNLLQHI